MKECVGEDVYAGRFMTDAQNTPERAWDNALKEESMCSTFSESAKRPATLSSCGRNIAHNAANNKSVSV